MALIGLSRLSFVFAAMPKCGGDLSGEAVKYVG